MNTKLEKFENILFVKLKESILSKIDKVDKTGSLKELVFPTDKTISKQSIMIRLGNIIEKSLMDFALDCGAKAIDKNMRKEITKIAGYKVDLDVAFILNDIFYYREVKSNLNLDTEKVKATYAKVQKVAKILLDLIDDNLDLDFSILSLRYASEKDIYTNLKTFFRENRKDLLSGYGEFFRIFGVEVSKEYWENLMRKIGELCNEAIDKVEWREN